MPAVVDPGVAVSDRVHVVPPVISVPLMVILTTEPELLVTVKKFSPVDVVELGPIAPRFALEGLLETEGEETV